eukprot:15126462-Alexandrium_andersonii.AAC.1
MRIRLASCAVGKANSTRPPSACARRMHALTAVVSPVPGLPRQMSGRLRFHACPRASSASSWSSLWFARSA